LPLVGRIPRSCLDMFKRELWKDQRRLEMTTYEGKSCLVKYFQGPEETEREVSILRGLHRSLTTALVPDVVAADGNKALFPYIHGIRVFNLLVELDLLEPPLDEMASRLKQVILARCEERQREIQSALALLPRPASPHAYPAGEKIGSMVHILSEILGIVVEWKVLNVELQHLDELWRSAVSVPFRDATTKNMVLAEPLLWLGAFDSEEARRSYLVDTLKSSGEPSWLQRPIYDYDFSSCVEDTTPEDDPISLLYHERTWRGFPDGADAVIWMGQPNPIRAALTFLVRYYRFGGRKAAYRLLHPSGHRIRFRHDNDVFYFQRLPTIVLRLWPDADSEFPELLSFTRTVARTLDGGRPDVDYFIAAGLSEKRRYYVDMYPE
jgi:hypothetical protein